MLTDLDSWTWPSAIVLAAFTIAWGFGPNCTPKDRQPELASGESEGPQPDPEPLELVGPDLGPPPDPGDIWGATRSNDANDLVHARQEHLQKRLNTCEAQGNAFSDCLWWVYGVEASVDHIAPPEEPTP